MAPNRLMWMVLGGCTAFWGWSASAGAQSCMTDSMCPKGFSCEVTAVSGCAVPDVAQPMPTPACNGGQCLLPPAKPVTPPAPCVQQEYRSCVPGNCMADGDCASGMVCHARSIGTCTSPPVAPCSSGMKCPQIAPPVCTDAVEHVCVPRYVLPCQQASDCGAGFTCEAQETCGCTASGSAGVPTPATPAAGPNPPPADAGADVPAFAPARPNPNPFPPPDCKCEKTAEKYCRVIETACRADVDCPDAFYCQQTAPGTDPGSSCAVPPPGYGDAGVCAADRALPAPPPAYRCVPRYDNVDPGYSAPHGGTGTGGAASGAPPVPMTTRPTTGVGTGQNPVAPTPGNAADAGVESGEAASEMGPKHVRACSVVNPGADPTRRFGLWTSLTTFAAAWAFAKRRQR